VLDLGEWWYKETQLPLPLGGNVIRKDLGHDLIAKVSKILRQSIEYALEHRDEALNYAMQFARDMEHELADKFVRDVRERSYFELRNGRAEGGSVAPQPRSRAAHHSQPIQVEFAD
jgi:predicted solute-binding protein